MGAKWNCIIIWIMFCHVTLWKHVQAASDSTSLNSFLHNYAFKTTLPKPRTGRLYEVSPPLNLSGIEVSVVRLRAHSLWRHGASLSSVEIPPRTLPSPFTKRVDIVYQNLGNRSTSYYNVPNYSLVAPVIGFLAYDSRMISMNQRLVELKTGEDNPISVRFHNISQDVRMRCVRFSSNGTLEFSNVTAESSCMGRSEGHYSIVIPYQPRTDNNRGVFKWWMVGIPAGIVGLIMVVAVGIVGFMLFKWRRVREMEKQSEQSESLDSVWIGNSRLPAASGIRTQPILENNYLP